VPLADSKQLVFSHESDEDGNGLANTQIYHPCFLLVSLLRFTQDALHISAFLTLYPKKDSPVYRRSTC
jgi:hypothetical protein